MSNERDVSVGIRLSILSDSGSSQQQQETLVLHTHLGQPDITKGYVVSVQIYLDSMSSLIADKRIILL